LRAVKELALAMRAELKKLDIEATTVAATIDKLLKPVSITAPTLKTTANGKAAPTRPSINGSTLLTPRTPTAPAAPPTLLAPQPQAAVELPLSQDLRIRTVLSSLAREAQDPLSHPRLGMVQTDAALDLTPWLTLRAGQERQFGRRGKFSLRTPLLNDADLLHTTEAKITSGGVDIALRPGITFSGNMARIAPETGDGLSATKLEGGLGLSGWQNRLVLTANVSRLMPEDSVALSTTAAELNVDLGLTERLSLKLLYQQLFGAQPQRQSDRVVAGGITINF
jgi:hypothetical protein